MSKRTYRHGLIALLLLGLTLTGCAAVRPQPPEVQLAGLIISDLSLSHANFLATLSVFNPNSSPLDIEGLEFALSLAEVQIAQGSTAKNFSIPAEQTASAALRLSTNFLDLFRLSQKLKKLDEVPFHIVGEVKIGGPGFLWMTVPIDSQGSIPLAGALEQLLFAPDKFWRQPGSLPLGGDTRPDVATPPPRRASL